MGGKQQRNQRDGVHSLGAVLSGVSGYSGVANNDAIAIDALGDAWVPNFGGGVAKLSSSGAVLSGASGYSGGGIQNPYALAIDGMGNVWVTNWQGAILVELSNTGTVLSGATGYTSSSMATPLAMAVDGSGNVWVTGRQTIEFIGAGTPVITPIAVGVKNNTLGTRP